MTEFVRTIPLNLTTTKGKGHVNPRVSKPLHKACGQAIIWQAIILT